MSAQQGLDVSEVGDVTVIRFADRRTLDGSNMEEIRGELFGLVGEGSSKKFLVNFLDVKFISSEPLNYMLLLNKRLKANGGSLRLCSLCPQVREIFTVTKLDQVFDIKEDELEALK